MIKPYVKPPAEGAVKPVPTRSRTFKACVSDARNPTSTGHTVTGLPALHLKKKVNHGDALSNNHCMSWLCSVFFYCLPMIFRILIEHKKQHMFTTLVWILCYKLQSSDV